MTRIPRSNAGVAAPRGERRSPRAPGAPRATSLGRTRWRLVAIVALVAAVAATGGSGQDPAPPATVDIDRAIEETRSEIESVRARLVSRRREILDARTDLARSVDRLGGEVERARKRLRELEGRLEQREQQREGLETRAARAEESLTLATARLDEAALSARDQLDPDAEAERAERLDGLRDRIGLSIREDRPEDLVPAAASLLDDLSSNVAWLSRVRTRPGRVIGPEGQEIEGTLVRVGGVATLFSARDPDAPCGLVYRRTGSEIAHLWPVEGAEAHRSIRSLAEGRAATAPVDVSAGAALRTREAERPLLEQLRSGGVVVLPILALAAICLLVATAKTLQLLATPARFDRPVARLLEHLRAGEIDQALRFAGARRRPLRRLLVEGVEHRSAPRADLEEILHEAILVELPRLERHLVVLSVGAVVAPLLGLLGTVTGMIHTFGLIEVFGTGDARLLSGGISEALVTTMAGLAVAIPLVLVHAFLSRRVHTIADALEKSAIGFINSLKARAPLDGSRAGESLDRPAGRGAEAGHGAEADR